LGVTQKVIYLPSINLVWASRAGTDPQIMAVMGRIIHWDNISKYFVFLTLSGRGGKKEREIKAETAVPIQASGKRNPVTYCIFTPNVVYRNEEEKISGSQPTTAK
jgi:hypothetical protein